MNRDFKGVWIPKEIWLNEELTLLEKIIFVEIDSLDNENHCTAGNEYFATFCNCSESKVSKAIKKLKDLNMIEELSFDGRCRKLSVVKNATESSKKCYAESQNLLPNNIDNKTNNKKSNSKELLQNFEFGNTKPKKDNLYTKCVKMIDDWTDLPELRELLITFLRMRLEVKDKPLYANQWKGMLRKLDAVQEECHPHDYAEIIQQSIDRGYLSFYPITGYQKSNNIEKLDNRHIESMTEEDYEEERKLNAERERNGLRTKF